MAVIPRVAVIFCIYEPARENKNSKKKFLPLTNQFFQSIFFLYSNYRKSKTYIDLRRQKMCCVKFLLCLAIFSGVFVAGSQLPGATCGTNVKTKKQSLCSPQPVRKQPKALTRGHKLRKKHNNELQLLKAIHERQLQFLKLYNGKTSQVTAADRDSLKALIEELPALVKKSDLPYLNEMAFIEYTVYAILTGKEKYKSKKKITDPEKLLKDIQKKQRLHMMQLQKREAKRVIR
jgi:hypothetical protein